MSCQDLLKSAVSGERLNLQQAMFLYRHAALHDLAWAAHRVRRQKHPDPLVTFVVDRNINYSNICCCGCKFCAFYRSPGHEEGFVLSHQDLARKIEETLALGGTQILLQGSHHPDLDLSFYEEMLNFIKLNYPAIHIHGFSPPEIIHFATISNLSVKKVLQRLIQAGLDSIPGGGAEILVDRVRNIVSANKCSAEQWLQVMEMSHELGLKTTATMMYGHRETPRERLQHLFSLRSLQDRTKGFTAFIPWPFQPDNTALKAEKSTTVEYLRLLALSRLVLDNFDNLQVSWVTMGSEVGQLGLFFGANDFGSTMIEENVVSASGVTFRLSKDEIENIIRDAGFMPRQRTMDYQICSAHG